MPCQCLLSCAPATCFRFVSTCWLGSFPANLPPFRLQVDTHWQVVSSRPSTNALSLSPLSAVSQLSRVHAMQTVCKRLVMPQYFQWCKPILGSSASSCRAGTFSGPANPSMDYPVAFGVRSSESGVWQSTEPMASLRPGAADVRVRGLPFWLCSHCTCWVRPLLHLFQRSSLPALSGVRVAGVFRTDRGGGREREEDRGNCRHIVWAA